MATKKQAALALGVSTKEILRMIDRGELKARRKTASKFSDWDIDLSSVKGGHGKNEAGMVEAKVKAVLSEVTAPPEAEADSEEPAETTQPEEQGVVEDEEVAEEKVVEEVVEEVKDEKPLGLRPTVHDVNPALERRRLFLLKRRQQRESQEKTGKESASNVKRTDSGRKPGNEGNGGSPKGSNQAPSETKGKEPTWWFYL